VTTIDNMTYVRYKRDCRCSGGFKNKTQSTIKMKAGDVEALFQIKKQK